MRKKKITTQQAIKEVLDELLKLSPEELKAKIKTVKRHWATSALEDAGYFDQFKKKKKIPG